MLICFNIMSQELHLELSTASKSLHQPIDTSKVVGGCTTDIKNEWSTIKPAELEIH